MASYKVPQDVEADDKLIGPFSFRQFIYLLIVAGAITVAYFLFRLTPFLVVIPLPVILFFGALALPLRKDQPMEIYLAAILSFYLKPRQRMWDPDGVDVLVQIAAPKDTEPQRFKDISTDEAEQRLRYLSDLSDSRGWSVRGVQDPAGSSLNTDVFNEAQQTQDLLDDDNIISQNLNYMINQNNERRHKEMVNRFQTAAASSTSSITTPSPAAPIPNPYNSLNKTGSNQSIDQPNNVTAPMYQDQPNQVSMNHDSTSNIVFNPYPTNINQSVIQPLGQQGQGAASIQQESPITTSTTAISPGIINLANNTDLSIETIAREAHRISEKDTSESSDEVVISLR